MMFLPMAHRSSGSVFEIQISFESIQIQMIQIQIPTFESPRFRFNESEIVELIQKRPIQIQSYKNC